jgi:hypothetical protein
MIAKRIIPFLICLIVIFYFGSNLYYWGQQNAFSSSIKSISRSFPKIVNDERIVSDEVTLIIGIRGDVTKEIEKSYQESSLLTAICIVASLLLILLFLLSIVFDNFQKSKLVKSGKTFPASLF